MSEWSGSGGSGGVTVILPSGESVRVASLTADQVKGYAENAGVNKFDVKDGNGNLLSQSAFDSPITSGVVRIEEYNEVKRSVRCLLGLKLKAVDVLVGDIKRLIITQW
jgi:hypothetical protein